ncbi:glycoside hydrolase [Microbacterium panaciterrae]|uniref:Family 43 glycosylhydrolase n=1 Tax=Microbacterium panaciterrae TaxID=985759 RepID=A0ABP8PNG6_9MICO
MSAPIFRDPVYDGATDPAVIRNDRTREWWMLYTQRRTTDPGDGVRWIHGTSIGIATSSDEGATWHYLGIAEGLGGADTLWAPEVIAAGGRYRMYLTVVDGVPDSWTSADAHIVEFVSDDLLNWARVGELDPVSDRVIDAAVALCGDGNWRLWYKNERDGSSTWSAVSADLTDWQVEGPAVPALPPHEGPNVFPLGGWYWMVTDEWRGLGVHRSRDARDWQRQEVNGGLILDTPGGHAEDRGFGHHADAVVVPASAGRVESAILFYFTHPRRDDSDAIVARSSPIHAARLTVHQGQLIAERDIATTQGFLGGAAAGATTSAEGTT